MICDKQCAGCDGWRGVCRCVLLGEMGGVRTVGRKRACLELDEEGISKRKKIMANTLKPQSEKKQLRSLNYWFERPKKLFYIIKKFFLLFFKFYVFCDIFNKNKFLL